MSFNVPSAVPYEYLWVNGPTGGTPLNAADLNQEETQVFNFVVAVADYMRDWTTVNFTPSGAINALAPVNTSLPVIS